MAAQSVRAWTCAGGYPHGLALTDIDLPRAADGTDAKAAAQVLVDIRAAALNPVDIQIMNLSSWTQRLINTTGPSATGRDFSGTVVAGGQTDFVPGDEVFGVALGGGTLARRGCFDPAAAAIAKKPSGWTHEQAAAIPLVWLTARTCVEDVSSFVEASPSKRLAVLGGSSSTGIYTTLLAKRRGWKVLATSSAKNRDFVLSRLDADRHVDYTVEDVRAQVAAFQPDAIVDCVGGTECLGIPGNRRYITIVGDKTSRASMGGPYTYYDAQHPMRMAAQWLRWARGRLGLAESYDVVILQSRRDWLEEAASTLSPDEIYIDSTFAFDDAKRAFERLNTGRAKGKVVVTVAG